MKFEDDLNEKEIHAQWSRLQEAIKEKQEAKSTLISMPPRPWKKYVGIAASVSLAVLFSIWLSGRSSRVTYTTAYGQQKHITLPDSSRVVLNSNSSISFDSPWRSHDQREVEIRGEAFFSVVHTPDDQQFIVRTPEGMQVEVLGTEFNVYDRRGTQRVVLNSGSVQLKYDNREVISMRPGEMVVKQGDAGVPRKTKVDPSRYSSWTSGWLVFKNTAVRDVCRQIEDNFGLIVSLPDTVLGNRLFNGTFPADKAIVLLKALMTTYQLEAASQGNTVRFSRKQAPAGGTKESSNR